MKQHITTADNVLIVASLCLIVASYVLANAAAAAGNVVLIQVDGVIVNKILLNETHEVVVKGIRGELTVQIRDGSVAVTRADCPNHVCVKTGKRSRGGEVIVCVPNKALVRIVAVEQKGIRSTTG